MAVSYLWQECLKEAWDAFCGGSVPVGAVWIDGQGAIKIRGRNRIHEASAPYPQLSNTRIAHAEMNVLVQVPPQAFDAMADGILLTTLEPCPLCMGAITMSGVKAVHYAARDRWAGSTGLLTASQYLARNNIRARGPEPQVESVSLALMTYYLLRIKGRRTQDILQSLSQDDAGAVALGKAWFDARSLEQAAERHEPIDTVIDAVLSVIGPDL